MSMFSLDHLDVELLADAVGLLASSYALFLFHRPFWQRGFSTYFLTRDSIEGAFILITAMGTISSLGSPDGVSM